MMAKCGWCKRENLILNRSASGRGGDDTLEEHPIPGTVKTMCRGPETYRDIDASGKPSRSHKSGV